MKFGPAGSFCSQQKEDVKTRWPTANNRSKHTVAFVLNRHKHDQQQQLHIKKAEVTTSFHFFSLFQMEPEPTETFRNLTLDKNDSVTR